MIILLYCIDSGNVPMSTVPAGNSVPEAPWLSTDGLSCPNATTVSDVEAAVHAGDITWHAFPCAIAERCEQNTAVQELKPSVHLLSIMCPNEPCAPLLFAQRAPKRSKSVDNRFSRSRISKFMFRALFIATMETAVTYRH